MNLSDRWQFYRLISRNNRLAFLRSPALQQGVAARVLLFLGGAMFVLYLVIYGTMFGAIAADSDEYGFLVAIMPFLLLLDFAVRFMVQQTPSMLLKPYLLLPIPRKSIVDCFLITSQVSIYNHLWLFMFLPYAVIVWAGGSGFGIALQIVVVSQLLIVVNSQFYLIVRALTGRSFWWWLLPLAVYGLVFVPLLIDTSGKLFGQFFDVAVEFCITPWLFLPALAVYAGVYCINRELQYTCAFEEATSSAPAKPVKVGRFTRFSFLESFGQTGEYVKLEMMSALRNKAIRGRVISSLALIIIFSALIAYTDIYDGRMMLNFWCFYCFALYGATTLVKVMCPEGNYIDFLLVHRENILALLRAKYYFHVAVLFVPFFIMLPAVIEGKFSWLMMLAYFLMTSGYLYFLLFQLAVYNNQTLPLDQKLTGKGNMENGLQIFIETIAFSSPIAIVSILLLLFSETEAYVILSLIGLFFTVSHPLWLRNVYSRMMKRKYENVEGFHASRTH